MAGVDITVTRKNEILDAVVRLNVETGHPVSSGLVSRWLRGTYSPATIRAVMVRLEKEGFLLKPHTSAGRLPTDRGFRAFVDRILSAWPLQSWEAPARVRRSLAADLQRSVDSGTLVKVLAALLSQLSANIGIIIGPSGEAIRATRIDLYPKENRRVLMVLVLEDAQVRSGLFELEEDYPAGVVEEAAQILSERIAGRTVAEIQAGVLPTIDLEDSPANRCACSLASKGRDLFAEIEEGELQLEGVTNVLDEPEFSEPGPLKSLIRFIESPPAIRVAMTQLNLECAGEVRVWIGQENPINELRSFSLFTSPFALSGREGILGVLGPRRMAYQQVFRGIDALRRALQVIR